MTKQFLDGSDVVPVLEQMRGERVSEGMTTRPLREAGLLHRSGDGALNGGFVQVKPARESSPWVVADPRGWKRELPGPLPVSIRVFSDQCIG